MIEFFLVIFIIIILISKKREINYQYLNVFLILFGTIAFCTSFEPTKEKRKFKSSFVTLPKYNSTIKPVLLIISDEYTSPDALYQVNKDSSVYQFSNELASTGWIIKNSFYSY